MSIDNTDDIIDSRDVIARLKELRNAKDVLDSAQEELDAALTDLENAEIELQQKDLSAVEYEEQRLVFVTEMEEADAAVDSARVDFDDAEETELTILEALESEAEGCGDWKYGETLIRDSHFKDYAQQLAEDTGMLKDTNSWPYTCIDWDMAAEELQHDYSSVDFDGETYWIRS